MHSLRISVSESPVAGLTRVAFIAVPGDGEDYLKVDQEIFALDFANPSDAEAVAVAARTAQQFESQVFVGPVDQGGA